MIAREISKCLKTYEQSGVNFNAGYEAVERMSSHVKRMMRKEVIGGLGGFGVTFDLSQLNTTVPVLVSGRYGVRNQIKTSLSTMETLFDNTFNAVAMCYLF